MTFEEELWWQNLEEWIFDNSKVVTYKYLAASLNVHVNAAKKMLFTYHDKSKKKTVASYLLAGRKDGGTVITVVPESDLPAQEKNLDSVVSKHVFALSSPIKDQQISNVLSNPDEGNGGLLEQRGIRCHKALEKSRETRFEDSAPSPSKEQPKVKSEAEEKKQSTPPAPKAKPSMFAKVPPKKEAKKETEDKHVDSKSQNAAQKESKPASKGGKSSSKPNAIASMFAKAPPKKEVKKETENKSDSPGKENKNDQSDDTKEASQNSKKSKTQSKPAKGRKRIQAMSSSESESEDEEKEELERMQVLQEDEVPQSPIKDDPDTIQETPKAKETKTGKKRVRKLMDKTFTDASGFLVTKKELVSCSEDEADEESSVQEPPAKKPNLETTKAAAKSNSGSKKQSSIMNFFKK